MVSVEHRGSHGDLLHRAVERGAAELRRVLEDADRELPAFVWQEIDESLACGDLRRGFA
jgi:hypothetical protein